MNVCALGCRMVSPASKVRQDSQKLMVASKWWNLKKIHKCWAGVGNWLLYFFIFIVHVFKIFSTNNNVLFLTEILTYAHDSRSWELRICPHCVFGAFWEEHDHTYFAYPLTCVKFRSTALKLFLSCFPWLLSSTLETEVNSGPRVVSPSHFQFGLYKWEWVGRTWPSTFLAKSDGDWLYRYTLGEPWDIGAYW